MSKITDQGTAKRLFLKAVELMAEAKALLVPRYFQLFYEYVEGSNRALANAFAMNCLQRNPAAGARPSWISFSSFTCRKQVIGRPRLQRHGR